MIGRSIAGLYPYPKRLIMRVWGYSDIHTRQKWKLLWEILAKLPDSVNALDAGCGDGRWTLELAVRRADWTLFGVDVNSRAIELAESARLKLELSNVSFAEENFLTFQPSKTFDLILSVASAHYLVESGEGKKLFNTFAQWLNPGGRLILLGPRRKNEVLGLWFLPPLHTREVFSRKDLEDLAFQSELAIERLEPAVHLWGTAAKQLSLVGEGNPILRLLLYPLSLLLDSLDRFSHVEQSVFWVLVARK